jgi:hypothetical protein
MSPRSLSQRSDLFAMLLGEGFRDCGARPYCDGLTGELLRITTCCVGGLANDRD